MTAQDGDRVLIHYTARYPDGRLFDTTDGSDPVLIRLGHTEIIPGFEQAIRGMAVGESKSAHIEPQAAFGEKRDELILEFLPEDLPEGVKREAGEQVTLRLENGHAIPARIIQATEQSVTLDANHPEAGTELIFEVEVVAINPTTT